LTLAARSCIQNKQATESATVKAFWDARVGDLRPGDFVKVECLCGHTEMLTGAMLRTAGLSEHEPIRGLDRRLRCRECDAKGKVELSIKWAK
jgi:hypothetical protein